MQKHRLFVHGSGGNPTDFRFLIEGLDRSRYQPWVYFYPTGMRLERQSELLYHMVAALQNQLEFRQLCVLAHSMGGLVARGAISEAVKRSSPVEFPTLILKQPVCLGLTDEHHQNSNELRKLVSSPRSNPAIFFAPSIFG